MKSKRRGLRTTKDESRQDGLSPCQRGGLMWSRGCRGKGATKALLSMNESPTQPETGGIPVTPHCAGMT